MDESRLSPVAHGGDANGRWELHDGPHPLIQSAAAVGQKFVVADSGGRSVSAGVGPPLAPDQVAEVGTEREHGRQFVIARCATAVASAVLHRRGGATVRAEAVRSATTGQHWIVFCLSVDQVVEGIDLLDETGAVLESQHPVPTLGPHGPRWERNPDDAGTAAP